MNDLKKQLTDYIEAFAVAKSTGNNLLVQQSATALVQFLEGVDVTVKAPDAEDHGGEG